MSLTADEKAMVRRVEEAVVVMRRKRMIEAMSVALDAALEAVGETGFEVHVLQQLIAGRIRSINTDAFDSERVEKNRLLDCVRHWILIGDARNRVCAAISVHTESPSMPGAMHRPLYLLYVNGMTPEKVVDQLFEAVTQDFVATRPGPEPATYLFLAHTEWHMSLANGSDNYFARHRMRIRCSTESGV